MAFSNVQQRWNALPLATRFLFVSAIVLLAGMGLVGQWISTRISDGVTHHTGAATALYMDSLIAPHLQELATQDRLSEATEKSIARIMSETPLGQRIQTIKVWKKGGLIAYSTRPDMIGETFEPSAGLRAAWQGSVSSEFEWHAAEENAAEKASGMPLLEMYVPVRSRDAERIIVVAEFYVRADDLEAEIDSAVRQSWAIVAVATIAMLLALWTSMRTASNTIENQRRDLEGKVTELTEVLTQNQSLRDHLQSAYLRTARLNERFLRRVGADLHDGPAQLIGLALLRLDTLNASVESTNSVTTTGRTNLERIRTVLKDALKEIRNLSAGLAVPELGDASGADAIRLAVQAHQARTGTKVASEVGKLPEAIPSEVTVCLYRFVQEGLNNAYRHAHNAEVKVRAGAEGEDILIEIIDDGPGFDAKGLREDAGMGLIALKDRVETLGGRFDVRSTPGEGARLGVRFNRRVLDELRADQ